MDHDGRIPWYRSIRFRLVAAAVIVEVCMLSLLLNNSFRLISDALDQQTRDRVMALTPLLNASLNGNVFQRNHIEIQSVLDQLISAESSDIRYLAVFDKRGQRSSRWPARCRSRCRSCSTPASPQALSDHGL